MAGDVKIRIKSVNAFEKGVKSAIASVKRLGRAVAQIAKAAFAAGAAAVGMGAVMMRAYAKQEESNMALAAALRNHGDSVDELMPRYRQFAAGIQKTTRYGDEAVLTQMAYARNLGVTADQLEDATRAAVGLAAKYRIDLQAAMMLVGRASQGQTQMLTRYGIVLDETLTQEEKFSALLKIGASAFGLAEEAAGTLTGRIEQLKNAWGDLLEVGGGAIAKATGLADKLDEVKTAINAIAESGALEDWVGEIKKNIETVLPVISKMAKAFGWMKEQLQVTAGFAGAMAGGASFDEAAQIVKQQQTATADTKTRIRAKVEGAVAGVRADRAATATTKKFGTAPLPAMHAVAAAGVVRSVKEQISLLKQIRDKLDQT